MWVSDSYEYIYALAETNLSRGDYETALANFERLSQRLSQLKPVVLDRRPELRNLLLVSLGKQAEIHHIRTEFDKAVEFYERAIEMAPDTRDRWHRNLALVRIDMGQAEQGLDELRAQAIAHPGDYEPWLTIGMECEALGRLDEAEENLRRAARSASDAEGKNQVYLALFDFYRAQGRVEEALAAWDQAWDDGQESDYVFPLYQMMWEIGDPERAQEYLRREKNPLRKGFHQGLLAAGAGEADEAAKHWKRVANLNPLDYDEGHEAWAEAALRVDRPPAEIIAALAAILEAGDFTLRGLILQAIAEARIGHVEHAQGLLETARNIGMRTRPREEELSPAHWALLDELVADEGIKEQLQPYFQAVPESAAEAAPE